MKDVRCPKYLWSKLADIWLTQDSSSPFNVIREVIDSVSNAGSVDEVLFHTLYRYMVLLGHCLVGADCVEGGRSRPPRHLLPLTAASCSAFSSSVVWNAVVDCLGLALDDDAMDAMNGVANKASNHYSEEDREALRQMAPAKKECLKQYKKDLAIWSIRQGKDDRMKRSVLTH